VSLLVIFGAGASFDSAPYYPMPTLPGPSYSLPNAWRPPLASQLFDSPYRQIVSSYPKVRAIADRLARSGASIEQTLQALWDDSHPERPAQFISLRYYLAEMIEQCTRQWNAATDGVTNYSTLLDVIHGIVKEQAILVTFNYDLLLDQALLDLDMKLSGIDDYLADPRFLYLKVHGSVDWARRAALPAEVGGGSRGAKARAIELAGSVKLLDQYYRQPWHTNDVVDAHGRFLVPAIAVPMATTKDYESPSNHLKALAASLTQVDRILVVGWRAADRHLIDMLRKYQDPDNSWSLLVAAGSSAEGVKVVETLRASGLRCWNTIFDGGFTRLVLSPELVEFLARPQASGIAPL
jgi:hypothetical protein